MVKNKKIKYISKRKKGGGQVSSYQYNGREIMIIGVNHLEQRLNLDMIKKIINKAELMRKVCYLIEFDKRLTNQELISRIKYTQEQTTKVIWGEIKNYYRNTLQNLCIRGWDSRQSMFDNEFNSQPKPKDKRSGQYFQNLVYSKSIWNFTMQDIQNYINVLPKNYKINKNLFHQNVGKYLQNQIDNPKTIHNLRTSDANVNNYQWLKNAVNSYINFLKQHHKHKIFKKPGDYVLKELHSIFDKSHEKQKIVDVIKNIHDSFLNFTDLITLEKILQKSNKTNYVIFLGLNHYENYVKHFKNLGIKLKT